MKKRNFFQILLNISLLFSASGLCSQTATTQKGLTTVTFHVSGGTIRVILPERLQSGNMISGTVIAEPEGGSAKAMEKSMKKLKQLQFYAGGMMQPFSSKLKEGLSSLQTLSNGKMMFQSTITVPFGIHIQTGKDSPLSYYCPVSVNDPFLFNSTSCATATHFLSGSPFKISGPFDGNAANTRCAIGGRPLEIIAETKGICFAGIPEGIKGKQALIVSENGQPPCSSNISAVDLIVTAGKTNLLKGEKTMINVQVTGLERLNKPAQLTVENKSVQQVKMEPGNFQKFILSPDTFKTSGRFSKQFPVQALVAGDFNIHINLDLPDIQYDLPAAGNFFKQNPGSYGWRGDDPCEKAGPIIWTWHRTLPCAVEIKVIDYGVTPAGKEIVDWIIDEFKKLSKKGGDIGSKMAKCFSFKGKAFSIYARCYREWEDWDVTYKCVGGVWVQTSMEIVGSDRDNLSDWIPLLNSGGVNAWLASDDYNWIVEAIQKAVTCCP